MIETNLITENKILPDWMTNHPIFKEVKQVKKIFPSIGLSNFEEDTELSNIDAETIAANLLLTLSYQIDDAVYWMRGNAHSKSKNSNLALAKILSDFYIQLSVHKEIIKEFTKTGKLSLYKDIYKDDNINLSKKTSVFKAYNALKEILKKDFNYTLRSLDDLQDFKDFSSVNSATKMKVVFSSDKDNGIWDIATMSMRGITSCQAWGGQYDSCVIGSVLDPFTGIIYLTSGSSLKLGTKMSKRCIVRFVVNEKTGKQILFLDRMYPAYHAETAKLFKEILKKKINNKLEVIDEREFKDICYIPYSDITGKLLQFAIKEHKHSYNTSGNHNLNKILSYRDTFIRFKTKPNFNEIITSLLAKVKKNFEVYLTTYLNSNTNISLYYTNFIAINLANTVINQSKIDLNSYHSTLTKNYKMYLVNHKSILEQLENDVVSEMKKFGHKSITMLGTTGIINDKDINFTTFMQENLHHAVSSYVQDEWKKILKLAKDKSNLP